MRIWQLAALMMGLMVPLTGVNEPLRKKNGIVDVLSNHSVDETIDRMRNILQLKGIKLFAVIDHSGEADKVGNENATDKAAYFRKSQGRYASHACYSKHRDRPPTQDSGLGRC